jgi:hypothetical protein
MPKDLHTIYDLSLSVRVPSAGRSDELVTLGNRVGEQMGWIVEEIADALHREVRKDLVVRINWQSPRLHL